MFPYYPSPLPAGRVVSTPLVPPTGGNICYIRYIREKTSRALTGKHIGKWFAKMLGVGGQVCVAAAPHPTALAFAITF